MSLLKLSGICKRFGPVVALDQIELSVARGEIHCLLGENGAGKSTLCNVVFGVHRPDAGTMELHGRTFSPSGPAEALGQGIAMVHQHFSLVSTMSVVENLMMGRARGLLDHSAMSRRIERLSSEYQLSVDPHRIVRDLSVGERQRVEIVKCLLDDPQLLVLDEPTAVLPPEEIDAFLGLVRRLADGARAVILVTHKLAEIAKVADRTTVMRHGRVVDSVSMRGADLRDLVRSMVGHEVQTQSGVLAATLGLADEHVPSVRDDAAARARGRAVLQLGGIGYRDAQGVTRLDDVNLTVHANEIVGLAGVEGNGQSELGAILAGLISASSGQIHVDGIDVTRAGPREITACGVGIVPEDRHAVACVSELSVAENLCLGRTHEFSRWGLLDRSRMRATATAVMREFDVRAASADAPIASLSGGNQQKAVLARELSLKPLKFLLAAQPTRGLDVGAVEAVYRRIQAARDEGLGVLMISSELGELMAVSDRIVVMYRGRIVGEMCTRAADREAIGAMMSGHVNA